MNEIVSLPLAGSAEPQVLAGGRDFYSFPRISPDGGWLAWTCWDHPNMPWDGTELWVAPLTDSGEERLVAGGAEESVFQPEWDPDGRLHFVSDRDGWWNLYRRDRCRAERRGGRWSADRGGGRLRPSAVALRRRHLRLPRERRDRLRALRGGRRTALPAAARRLGTGRPRAALHLLRLPGRSRRAARRSPSPRPARRARRRSSSTTSGAARRRWSAPRARSRSTRPTSRGRGRSSSRPASGEVAHGFFYPPANPGFEAPGGGTAAADRREPRRADLPRHPGAEPRVPLLDQPRDRRRRRQLPRLQRLRPRVPQQAARDLGRGRHRGLRQRGAATWPSRARPTGRGWRSAAAPPAATRPSARSPSTTPSPPARATSASPTPRRSPATPTSSSRATWIA